MTVIERKYASLNELDLPIGDGISNPDRLEWLRQERYGDFMIDIWFTQEHDEMGKALLAYRLVMLDSDEVERVRKANRAPSTMQDQMGPSYQDETLNAPVWEIIFSGEDFHCGLGTAIDDDQVLADILGLLSLKPGDTEDDYFRDHTPRQMEFVTEHGEELSVYSSDLEGSDE